jgi:hypothetical protein
MFPMNVKGIIDNLQDSLGYAPSQSKTARETFLRIMNRVQLEIVQLAPYLFFEEEMRLLAKPGFDPESTDVLYYRGPNLFRRKAAYDPAKKWPSDFQTRTLQIVTPNGIKLDARIRRTFQDTEGGVQYEFISLFDSIFQGDPAAPFNAPPSATQEYPYCVYDRNLILPKNLVKLNNVVMSRGSDLWPAKVVEKAEAEYLGYTQRTAYLASSDPYTVWRDGYNVLTPPTAPPKISLKTGNWNQAEPGGEFEYCYTYCFGYLLPEATKDPHQVAPGNQDVGLNFNYVPFLESAPSPISEKVTVAYNGVPPELELSNIYYEMGWHTYPGVSTPDPGSQLFYRIYRRRKAVSGYASATVGPQYIGTTDHFELIATTLNTTVVDRGSFPNKRIRLNYNHGNELLGIFPPPNNEYLLTVRGIFVPDILIDDTDTPKIKPEAMELFLALCSAKWYERMQKQSQADKSYLRAGELLKIHAARYGMLMPDSRVIIRRPARGFLGERQETRVWWGTRP